MESTTTSDEELTEAWELWLASTMECEYCGRRFIPKRSDQSFCYRVAPGETERSCQQVAPQRRYAERISPERAAYRREYKRLDNCVRRGQMTRAELDAWREANRPA